MKENIITEEMIEAHRLEKQRKRQQKWRDQNRQHVNAYAREWRRQYREKTGVSYDVARGRKQAEEELRAQL